MIAGGGRVDNDNDIWLIDRRGVSHSWVNGERGREGYVPQGILLGSEVVSSSTRGSSQRKRAEYPPVS